MAVPIVEEGSLTQERFERIRESYWVCSFSDKDASTNAWLFGVGDDPPPPVPNRQMGWRRPTYQEAVERQRRWAENPKRFDKDCFFWSERFRWKWRSGIARSAGLGLPRDEKHWESYYYAHHR